MCLLGSVIFILFCCLPFSNLSSTLTNYPSPVSGQGRASILNRMSFFSNKIVPWAVFPVFVRFDIILVFQLYFKFVQMFSLCSVIINASSISSSLQVPFPSPVTFCSLFSCLHVSYFGEVCQLPPAVRLPVSHLGGAEQLTGGPDVVCDLHT